MAETLSWRLAPVSTTERGAPLWSTRRFIFAPRLPLSVGFLPVFSPSRGAGEFLESIACHFQEIPPLSSVVLGHALHQLLEDAHLPPPLETLVDDALEETPNHSRWMAFHWQPLQSTYHIALATALSDTLGLPPRLLVLFLFLGRCFLSFLHRGRGRRK